MTETKSFPTPAVLSAITGMLICDIGNVYEVLQWMTDGPVWTHQLPRIGREAEPVLLAAHPSLAEAIAEAQQINPDNWETWRDRWIERYGPTLEVPKFTADQHEAIDPLSELAETFHPSKIVVVGP